MAGPGILVLLLLLLLAAAGVVLLVVALTAVRGPAPAPSEAARAAVRHGAVVHAVALVLLLGTLVVVPTLVVQVATGPAQGVALGLAPALAGLAFAATQALGEATWPRPTGSVRRAPLTRRTVRDIAPPTLRAAAWGWAALGALALVAGGLASDDGRSIERAFVGGTAGSGPFPGWFYGVPLLAAVAVVLVAAEGVLRLVATRPSVADADPAWDLSLRRTSAHRVLRGAQLVLAWTAAGVLGTGGMALRGVASVVTPDPATASAVHAAAGTVALVLAGVAVLGGTVLAVLPAAPVATRVRLGTGGVDAAAA